MVLVTEVVRVVPKGAARVVVVVVAPDTRVLRLQGRNVYTQDQYRTAALLQRQ